MHFLFNLSAALAFGLSLGEARAVNGDVKRASLTARQTQPIDPDITIARNSFYANIKKCGSGNSKHKRALVQRQSSDEYPLSDDPPSPNQDLGGKTETFPQGETTFLPYDEAREDNYIIVGTVGLNSCSGVLVVGVGENGAVLGDHLNPIGANDDGSPREGDYERFQSVVQEEIIDEIQKPEVAPMFQGATMYVAVPETQLGESTILGAAASTLGLTVVYYSYPVVDASTIDDSYIASGKGSMWVNFTDNDNPVVTIFGEVQKIS